MRRLPDEYGATRLIVKSGQTKLAESCLYSSGMLYSKIEHGFELRGRHVQDFAISVLSKLAGYGVRAKLLICFGC